MVKFMRSVEGKKTTLGANCCSWTDFQLAVMITAHDDDFKWLSEGHKASVMSRLRMSNKIVQKMHGSFKVWGYPMPRKLFAPTLGTFDIALTASKICNCCTTNRYVRYFKNSFSYMFNYGQTTSPSGIWRRGEHQNSSGVRSCACKIKSEPCHFEKNKKAGNHD